MRKSLEQLKKLHLFRRPNSLKSFHSKRDRLWRFHVAENNKTYLVPHVKFPIFSHMFNQVLIFSTKLNKNHQYRIYGNISNGSLADTCRQKGRSREGNNEANRYFRDYATALRNWYQSFHQKNYYDRLHSLNHSKGKRLVNQQNGVCG
jgi:deoxyadenosine/deoxycytidine kinase